jgi:hypothetical protein
MGVDRWPCDPAVERANYRGFGYLVSELAGAGLRGAGDQHQCRKHLRLWRADAGRTAGSTRHICTWMRWQTAAAGGANDFGVELAGRADLSRLAIFGHSRGARRAVALARAWATDGETRSYGPAMGCC